MAEEVESCKVVLLGESGVGKTSIITQFTEHNYFDNPESTSGATFSSKEINLKEIQKDINFEIWDTAGQEKFRSLTKMFYNEASVAVLVYDITRPESFEEIKNYWSVQIKENAPKNIIIAVAANKADLYEHERVDEGAGRNFASSINAIFKPTSAKNTTGIEDLFYEIGLKYFKAEKSEERVKEEEEERKKVKVKVILDKKKEVKLKEKRCCK